MHAARLEPRKAPIEPVGVNQIVPHRQPPPVVSQAAAVLHAVDHAGRVGELANELCRGHVAKVALPELEEVLVRGHPEIAYGEHADEEHGPQREPPPSLRDGAHDRAHANHDEWQTGNDEPETPPGIENQIGEKLEKEKRDERADDHEDPAIADVRPES